ncbi:hypothetical protein [Bradyrhizobium sp. USDA 3262]
MSLRSDNHSTTKLSSLLRDPFVAAAFKAAEDEGTVEVYVGRDKDGALVSAFRPRTLDGGASRVAPHGRGTAQAHSPTELEAVRQTPHIAPGRYIPTGFQNLAIIPVHVGRSYSVAVNEPLSSAVATVPVLCVYKTADNGVHAILKSDEVRELSRVRIFKNIARRGLRACEHVIVRLRLHDNGRLSCWLCLYDGRRLSRFWL